MVGTLAVVCLCTMQTATTLELEISVERPPAGGYGVVSTDALKAPLVFQIEGPHAISPLACEAEGTRVVCRSASEWFQGPGRYRLVARPAEPPTEGQWRASFDLPAETSAVRLRGTASLRFGNAGLRVESVTVFASAPSIVGLSSSWLAHRPAHERTRNDSIPFELTNGSPQTIFIEGVGTRPYGRLYYFTENGARERVRHGQNLCGDLYSKLEFAVEPYKMIALSESMNERFLEPGRYQFEVYYTAKPTDAEPPGFVRTIVRISYEFEIQ